MKVNLTATTWTDLKTNCTLVAAFQHRGDEDFLIAVRNDLGQCLNKSGDFEYEPMPSSRSDEFLERCRWDNFNDAHMALERWTNGS